MSNLTRVLLQQLYDVSWVFLVREVWELQAVDTTMAHLSQRVTYTGPGLPPFEVLVKAEIDPWVLVHGPYLNVRDAGPQCSYSFIFVSW